MLKTVIIVSVLISLAPCQRNPFKVFQNGRLRPKCSDNSRPTCVCPDGTEVTRFGKEGSFIVYDTFCLELNGGSPVETTPGPPAPVSMAPLLREHQPAMMDRDRPVLGE